jgi:hypothetical protein
MGDPYLSSNESLILSTHNIRIDGVALDLMLTSRRLILIDNSVTPFSLRTIPLDTIITVVSGTDVKGDPIITISSMESSGSGAPQPMDLIFARQKGEQRATECNEWAATLRNFAAEARSGSLSAGTLPYDPVKAIQPRMSATYRIETFSPRKPIMEESPVTAEPVISYELPEPTTEDGIPTGTGKPAQSEPAGIADPFVSPVISPREPEDMNETIEPVQSGKENSGADISRPSVPVPEELIEGFYTSVHESARIDATDMEHELLPVSLQSEVPFESNEKPVITEAARIWADAARSAASFAPPVPDLSVPEAIPIMVPRADESIAESCPVEEVTEKPAVEMKEDPRMAGGIIPESLRESERLMQSRREIAPVFVVTPPAPSVLPTKFRSSLFIATILIILVVLGGMVIVSFQPHESGITPHLVVVPNITVQQTPTNQPTTVPADGVWVRIEYSGTFIGEVGNTELMHPVSGTGVRIYKILRSDHIVQASAQKQENSGDPLIIEVFNNGTLIKRSSTRVPMGSVDILIDPITGQPPGIRPGEIP